MECSGGNGAPTLGQHLFAAMGEYDGVAAIVAAAGRMDTRKAVGAVVSLAAHKFMLGKNPSNSASYTKETKFGVAALLCRLCLRAHSTSSSASQAVADFMSTLLYVNYKHDGVLSSYESEPALAFGATHVWYSRRNALAEYILPQFKKMVLNETFDAGANGEVVARIVLLLVMDAAVVMESEEKTVSPSFTISRLRVNWWVLQAF